MAEIRCCLCSKITASLDQLESHLALKHFNSSPYQCEICLNNDEPSSFPTEVSIRNHIDQLHGTPKFYYRVWGSADIDRDRAEIRKCIEKSVQQSVPHPPEHAQNSISSATITGSNPLLSQMNTTASSNGQSQAIANSIISESANNGSNTPSSSTNGRTSEEQLPAVTEDGASNVTDFVGLENWSSHFSYRQIKREPVSVVTEEIIYQNDPETSEQTPIESNDKLKVIESSANKRRSSGTLMDWLSHRPLPVNQSATPVLEKQTAKKRCPDQSGQVAQGIRRARSMVTAVAANQPDAFNNFISALTQSQKKQNCSERRKVIFDGKSINCSECSMAVNTRTWDMKSHINKFHLNLPLYKCEMCKNEYYEPRRDLFLRHIRKAHRTRDNCGTRNRDETNWKALDDHLPTYFPDASFEPPFESANKSQQVPQSSKTQRSKSEVSKSGKIIVQKNGVVRHSGERKGAIQCTECKKWIGNTISIMKFHINTKHTRLPIYQCKICKIDFYGKVEVVRDHVNKHHNAQMDAIDSSQKYVNWTRLDSHFRHYFPTFSAAQLVRQPARVKAIKKIRLKRFQAAQVKLRKVKAPEKQRPKSRTTNPLMVFTEPYLQQMFGDHKLNRNRKTRCRECKELLSRKNDYIILNHVNIKHLQFPVFQCTACQMVFSEYSGSSAKKHVNLKHDGDTQLIQDRRGDYHEEIQKKCVELFGAKPEVVTTVN